MSQYSSYTEEVQTPGVLSPEEMERAQHMYEDLLLRSDPRRIAGRLARTYAESLLEVAEQRGEADAVAEQFQSLGRDVFPNAPGLEALLDSAAVNKRRKDEILTRAFDGRATPLFLDFLRLLNRKDRLGLLRLIAIAYRTLREQKANRQRILVEVAAPIAADQTAALETTLAAVTGKTPVLIVRVRPELLGGLVVHLGDRVFDSSVRTKLRTVRNNLFDRGSNEIQGRRDRFSHQ